MIKRVNFTGRRRIPRNRIDIQVHDGQPRTFDATIDLPAKQFPEEAAIFLEAMCAGSSAIQRFAFGKVGAVQAPRSRSLHEIEGENVFFTLKVVDQSERIGRILGIAENIRPLRAGRQTAAGRRGILPIEQVDLKHELWRLDFREHDVYLLVARSDPDLVERIRWDPAVYAMLYPEIVRRILTQAIDENVDVEEDDDRWSVLWLRFGRSLHPDRETPPGLDDSEEEQAEWVDEVIQAFCERHSLRQAYLAATHGRNGGDS